MPIELMQSTASLMSLAAQRSFSISRSLSTPVDVSQWTAQSQFAPAARSSAASIRSRSHWEPPVDPQDLEPQQHPPRVVHKSVPKLAAADDQSATGEQRKLARYRVVGHRA